MNNKHQQSEGARRYLEQEVACLRTVVKNRLVAVNTVPAEQHIENVPHSFVEPENLLSGIGDTNNENPIESESRSQHNGASKNTCTTKVKIPDPSMIDIVNGIDTPLYKYWYTQMQEKMEGNAHLMPTESDCMIYIQSRIGPSAMSYLMPRLRPESTNQITTVKEMFEVLKASLGDPDRARNARIQYQNLRQGNKEFTTFWAEFQQLAAELDHSEPTLINDLINKFHYSIQIQLSTGQDLPTKLVEVARRCQRIWQLLKEANQNKFISEKMAEQRKTSKPTSNQ